MELRAQVGALSSAAWYGSKLPRGQYKELRRGAAGSQPHEQREASYISVRAAVEKRTRGEGLTNNLQNIDLPPIIPKNQKKPWITPPRRGGFLRKLKRGPPKLRWLPAPDNGLLVPRFIPVAHQIHEARTALYRLVPKLMQVVPVHVCRSCAETHVGPVGHEIASCTGPRFNERHSRHLWTVAKIGDVIPSLETYHLYDRLKSILHTQRFGVPRLPALVELSIQAGVEIPKYPVLRRKRPVKALGRTLVEQDNPLFEFDDLEFLDDSHTEEASMLTVEGEDDEESTESKLQEVQWETSAVGEGDDSERDTGDGDGDGDGNQDEALEQKIVERAASLLKKLDDADVEMTTLSVEELAQVTLDTWQAMRNGAKQLMTRYPVRVCGYCPEVHIGPRGHKVKECGAFKHQWRAGQHGWQKATIDDLIPPKYVWHVQNLQAPLLKTQLRRYYGQAPAIVELCVQAGAAVPDEFRPMMRMDVVVPAMDEVANAV